MIKPVSNLSFKGTVYFQKENQKSLQNLPPLVRYHTQKNIAMVANSLARKSPKDAEFSLGFYYGGRETYGVTAASADVFMFKPYAGLGTTDASGSTIARVALPTVKKGLFSSTPLDDQGLDQVLEKLFVLLKRDADKYVKGVTKNIRRQHFRKLI